MHDPWARHRKLLYDAVTHAAETITLTQGDLVREQLEASQPREYDMPPLVCLRACEAVGGSAEAALPAATALALLGQMGLVFSGLESQHGSASLSTAWGMPRSLNAGDAFFAAAQVSLLSGGELTAERRLQSVTLLDKATRGYLEAVYAANDSEDPVVAGQRALLPPALALGALMGGADTATQDRFASLGKRWASMSTDDLALALAGDIKTALAGTA